MGALSHSGCWLSSGFLGIWRCWGGTPGVLHAWSPAGDGEEVRVSIMTTHEWSSGTPRESPTGISCLAARGPGTPSPSPGRLQCGRCPGEGGWSPETAAAPGSTGLQVAASPGSTRSISTLFIRTQSIATRHITTQPITTQLSEWMHESQAEILGALVWAWQVQGHSINVWGVLFQSFLSWKDMDWEWRG